MVCQLLSHLRYLSQSSLEKLHDDFCSKVFYDPETGYFHHRLDSKMKPYEPPAMGPLLSDILAHDGYTYISLMNSRIDVGPNFSNAIRADALAWFYMIGERPMGDFEYIDGNKANNSFSNIRFVYRSKEIKDSKILAKRKRELRDFMYSLGNSK